jgi:hypothetical protein
MNDDELRQHITRARRITRDPGILALISELERRLDAPSPPPIQHRTRGFRGGPGPPSPDDARIRKAIYQREFMRKYRAKKKAEKLAEEAKKKCSGPQLEKGAGQINDTASD